MAKSARGAGACLCRPIGNSFAKPPTRGGFGRKMTPVGDGHLVYSVPYARREVNGAAVEKSTEYNNNPTLSLTRYRRRPNSLDIYRY